MGWHAVRAPVRQQGHSLPTKTDPGQQRFTTRKNTTNPLSQISIPFLVKTAQMVLRQPGIRRFHLVGHSMGGLTALLLAHQDPAAS